MQIALWAVNVLLALAFLGAGATKLAKPRAALLEGGMGWVEDAPDALIKAIGAAEVLGALGLILPLATGIAPVLTPVAALALALTMVGAIVTHVRRQEPYTSALVLGLVALGSAVLGFLAV